MRQNLNQKQTIESVIFHQVQPLGVLSPALKEALLAVDRLPYLPPANRSVAYADTPIVLKRRCELPFYTLALMLQGLGIPEDAKDRKLKAAVISAGMGYSSTILSHLCDWVEAFEGDSILFARLLATARNHPNIHPITALSQASVDFILMDGGGVNTIPEAVISKLNSGGRLAVVQPVTPTPSQPLHPDMPCLTFPLSQAVIYERQNDGTLEVMQKLFYVNIPVLPTAQGAKTEFKF